MDELTRSDHWYLTDDDSCYFIGEYTARKGYAYSDTNNLIYNLKKSMDRSEREEWKYKKQAIQHAARAFEAALHSDTLDYTTFIPVPPSKAKGDPLYDDRLLRMLHAIRSNPSLDIREIVVQEKSTNPVHIIDTRPTPEQIQEIYSVDKTLLTPEPEVIAIVDDILTTGAHFRAASSILSGSFPETPLVGLFVARRAIGSMDTEHSQQ